MLFRSVVASVVPGSMFLSACLLLNYSTVASVEIYIPLCSRTHTGDLSTASKSLHLPNASCPTNSSNSYSWYWRTARGYRIKYATLCGVLGEQTMTQPMKRECHEPSDPTSAEQGLRADGMSLGDLSRAACAAAQGGRSAWLDKK